MSTTTATGKAVDPSLDLDQYMQNLSNKKSTTATTSKAKAGTLGKDDFMTLLVTQLRYQDPLNPQDNSQMAAQMAQFSSLESMQNVQKAVEGLGSTFTEMGEKQAESASAVTSSSATSMIGKSVRFRQESVSRPAVGEKVDLTVHAKPGSVVIISDVDGNTIRTIGLDGTNDNGSKILNSLGDGSVSWDGKDDSGKYAAAGTYTVAVGDQATLEETGYAYQDSSITSVSFDSEGPMLQTGSQAFRMKDLVEVHASADATSSATSGTVGAGGSNTSAALTMIGRTAKFRESSADLAPTEVVNTLGNKVLEPRAKWTFSAADGSIGQIMDKNGKVVKTFSVSERDTQGNVIMDPKTATGAYVWDGGNADNDIVSNGTYYLRIVDPTQTKTAGTAYREEKIDTVAFDGQGNPKLLSGTDVWSLADLFTIN